jgi:hypothetical protein
MTRRFMNVLRGYRGETAKTKFLDHLKGIGQGDNIGTKGSRPASQKLYVQAFGQDLGVNLFLQVSALAPSFTGLNAYSEIAARAKTTLTATQTSVKIKGFTAARVVRRTKDSTGTVKTSKLTGLKYLHYTQPSISMPLGRKGATDTQGEAFDDIRIQIPGTFSVSFIDERI